MTMVIACERCFCVISPLRSQHILTTRSTLTIIVLAFSLIVGTFFVIGTRWSLICVFNPRTNSFSSELYPSKFYLLNRKLINTLDGVAYGLVLPGTFVVVIIISTIVTVSKLKQMATWRGKASSSAAMSLRDVALTRMLIGCSVLFIVCTVPGVTFRTLTLFVPELSLGGRYTNTFTVMTTVTSRLCVYINSSFNFFIYYSMGTKYRETLNSICRRRRRRSKASRGNARVDSTAPSPGPTTRSQP